MENLFPFKKINGLLPFFPPIISRTFLFFFIGIRFWGGTPTYKNRSSQSSRGGGGEGRRHPVFIGLDALFLLTPKSQTT